MQPQTIKKERKPYFTINCCSKGPSISQTLAVGLVIGIQMLGCNLIPSMLEQRSPGMYFLMALTYLSLALQIIQYTRLLVVDPSDPRLKDPNFQAQGQQKQCQICRCHVAASSYHCQSCQRCVDQFDHHCTFANNCVGKQNYSIFIRLLIAIIIHTSTNIGISLWLGFSLNGSYQWLAVAFGGLNFVVFAQVTVLVVFHFYISFCLFKTTLQVIRGDDPKPVSIKIIKEIPANGESSNMGLVKVSNDFGMR